MTNWHEGGARRQGMLQQSDPGKPLISVITATFNAAGFLSDAIRSIREQKYPNIEWIVIDGGSTDATVGLLKENDDVIASWLSEPDCGIAHAWNKAIKQARGEWICFLGADDYFRSENVLSDLAPHLVSAYPPIRVVYSRMAIVNKAGDELYRVGDPWKKVRKRFLGVMCLPHPGLMHHRSLFTDLGGFDESFRISADYEFLLRELKHAGALFVPGVTSVAMRQGGVSSNPSNALRSLWEVRRAQAMHGLYVPRWQWLLAVARVGVRRLLWKTLGETRTRRLLDWGRQLAGKPRHWTRT